MGTGGILAGQGIQEDGRGLRGSGYSGGWEGSWGVRVLWGMGGILEGQVTQGDGRDPRGSGYSGGREGS